MLFRCLHTPDSVHSTLADGPRRQTHLVRRTHHVHHGLPNGRHHLGAESSWISQNGRPAWLDHGPRQIQRCVSGFTGSDTLQDAHLRSEAKAATAGQTSVIVPDPDSSSPLLQIDQRAEHVLPAIREATQMSFPTVNAPVYHHMDGCVSAARSDRTQAPAASLCSNPRDLELTVVPAI
jgi:hypothetical protein